MSFVKIITTQKTERTPHAKAKVAGKLTPG